MPAIVLNASDVITSFLKKVTALGDLRVLAKQEERAVCLFGLGEGYLNGLQS